MWEWLAIGAAGAICGSVFVGFALARILGVISEEISDLADLEPWASTPLTRARSSHQETLSGNPPAGDAALENSVQGEHARRPKQTRQRANASGASSTSMRRS